MKAPPPKIKRVVKHDLIPTTWGKLQAYMPLRISHHANPYKEHMVRQLIRARHFFKDPQVRPLRETEFNNGHGYTIHCLGFDNSEMQLTSWRSDEGHGAAVYMKVLVGEKPMWFRLYYADLSDMYLFSHAQETYEETFCKEEITKFVEAVDKASIAFKRPTVV